MHYVLEKTISETYHLHIEADSLSDALKKLKADDGDWERLSDASQVLFFNYLVEDEEEEDFTPVPEEDLLENELDYYVPSI